MQRALRLLFPLLLLAASAASAAIDPAGCQRIDTGPGPGDMVVQRETGQPPRLLLSSHDRRHFSRTGEIQAYTPDTGRLVTLTRLGEPVGFRLRPHGIDLIQRDGHWLLYVVSHDRDQISDQHAIVIYELAGNTLKFQQMLRSPLLSAVNDVAVTAHGDIYATNERESGNSILELILLERKANVVLYRPSLGWTKVAGELAYANDVLLQGNSVWVAQTLGSGLMHYQRRTDDTLLPGEQVSNLSLLSGLSLARNGHLLVTRHPSLIQLGLHWQHEGSRTPSEVYDVNPQTGEAQILFQDDGQHISAITAAVQMDNRLFLGQFFDSFILSCPMPTGY